MENQVELENNNQPQPPTYTKGLFLNLQQAFGKENLPDEATFTKKITTDKVYRDGVHKNLIAAYGQENVPDLSTFDSKVLGSDLKKKEQPVPIEKPSEIFAKSFQSDATKKTAPTTSELGAGEEAPIVPSWKMGGKEPLAKESTFVRPTTKIDIEKQQQIKEIQNNALTNTAKNKLSAKGLQATPANISSEIKNIEKAAKDGEVSLVRQGNEYYYGRTPKWHEEFAKQFVNTIGKFTDNIDILVADSKNDPALMAKTLDDIKARKDVESRMTFNVFDMMKAAIDPSTSVAENAMKMFNAEKDKTPLAKPSLAGDIAGFVGGIAPKAMASSFGLVPTAVQAVMTSSQDKIEQLYDKYQQDFLSSDPIASAEYQQTGVVPQKIKEAAATRAIKNADIQATPTALLDAILFSGTGAKATPQAKNLGEALAKGFKHANIMGAKGTAAELATIGIEQAQGDKPEDIVRRLADTYGNWVAIDASFRGLEVLKSLPKYLSSAIKDFATSKEAKPIVDDYLNKLPNGKEIKAELNKWEEDKKPLEGIVPEDKMASVAGLNQKIKGLKEKLNEVPDSLKEDIKIQIDNTNKQIKDIVSSDKPSIDFEKDDLTGEILGEKPIEVLDEKGNVISTTDKTVEINAKYDAELKAVESLLSKEQPPTVSDVESTAKALEEPSVEQQLKDIKEGNTVTFEYKNESEVPEVFKDKISSKGEINGKPFVKVTMAKSLADFYLQEKPKSESLLSKEQPKSEAIQPEGKANKIVAGVELKEPTQEQNDILTEERKTPEWTQKEIDKLEDKDVIDISEIEKKAKEDEDFAILTGTNPEMKAYTDAENAALQEKAIKWLEDKGYKPKKVVGRYGQGEASFFVDGMSLKDASDFRKEFQQDSVAHSKGMIYEGKYEPRVKGNDNFNIGDFTKDTNFATAVKQLDGSIKAFSLDYDFGNKKPLNELIKTEPKAEIKAEPKTVADTVADDLFTHLGIEPEVEPKVAQQELVEKTKLKVDDVKNALSSIAPDIKIEMHETVADTEAGARKAGLSEEGVQESKKAGGYYNPNTNTIHLNLEKIKSNTLFHEGVHPILNAINAIDSKAVDKLFNQVKTIEKRLGLEKKYSEDFASVYEKNQQSMEAVTEFLADVVDGKIKINETNFDKVKQFFVDMMKAVGVDLSNKIKTIQDLKKLADSIVKGFERGDVIRIDESGEPLTKSPIEIKDIQTQKITGEKVEVGEHKLSFVKESDLFDIDKFLKEVSAKKQKIWFWVADQLGRGMYTDKVVNGEHYLDAGASYALDPVNRNKGIIWATGKGNKWIEGKIKESDYIAIISGSPEKSKLFNKQVFDLFGKRIKNYDAFKKDVLKVSNVSEINNLLKEFENFEDLKNNPKRKDLLLAINDQKGKKTPLVDVLNKYNAFLDYNELRDGFYADNDFKMNDIMLVLKPESFGGESKHSTYENDILGKVIGVPNKKINAYDLLPSDVKQKYEVSIAEKNKQRLAEGKAAVSFAESQKAQVVAPYGVGVKEIQYQKPTKGVDLVEQSGKRKEMTEDDKGNYLFFHYSDKKFNKLSPEKVGKHLATGRDERTSVPTSSLYTRPDRLETNVPSDFGYITRVPKEKVYSFTADPLNLMAEAEKRFKKENKDRAFDANNQFAYVAKIASEKGFPITVAEWNIKGTKTLIAKTTEALPLEKYSNIKAGTTNQIEFAKGTEDIKPNAKRRDIQFQKEEPTAKKIEDVTIEPIDFENESENIDVYEASEKAGKIAKDNGINILRGKDLRNVALNKKGDVVGGLWTEVDGNEFSFDIAIDKVAQGKGIGEKLVNEAISEFNTQDYEGQLKYKIDVTNPIMEKLLSKYGFEVVDKIPGHTIMEHPTNNPKLKAEFQQKKGVEEVKFSKENQDAKIKDFIEMQREKGISDKDIKAGLEKAADRIGLDKNKIDELLTSKKEANAIQEPSPEGVLQPTQEGVGEAGGKRTGMEQAEQGAIPPKEGKPSEAEVGGAEKKIVYTEAPKTAAKVAELNRVRGEFGLSEFEPTEEVSTLRRLKNVENTIADLKKSGKYEEEINKIKEKAARNEISDEGQDILTQRLADLRATAKTLDRYSPEYDKITAQIKDVTDTLKAIGTIAGRTLEARKHFVKEIETVHDIEENMLQDLNTDTLTKAEKDSAQQKFDEYQKINEAAEKALQAKNEELAKLKIQLEEEKAKNELLKQQKAAQKTTPKTKDDYKKERESIKQSIKDKWNNAGKDIISMDLPYRKQLAAITPEVSKLVYSYLEQAAKDPTISKKVKDIVEFVKKELKEFGINISDRETLGLVSGEYVEKKQTRNELSKERYELQKEADLLTKIDDLQNDIVKEKDTDKQRKKSTVLKDLEKQLDDLQKQMKVGKYSDEARFEATAKQQIAANKKKIEEIQQKIKKGDFAPETKKESILLNEELQKKNPAIYNEWLDTQVKKEDWQKEYENSRLKDQAKKLTLGDKIAAIGRTALNTYRTAKATGEISTVLVQNILPSLNNPRLMVKFIYNAFKNDLLNGKKFKKEMAILKNSELGDLLFDKMKISLYEPMGIREEAMNELLGGNENLLNKTITIGGKKYSFGQAFERLVDSYANNLRIELASREIEYLLSKGKTWENAKEEYLAVGRRINEESGHGKLAKPFQNASKWLNMIIWSTKMMSSTFNVLGMGDLIRPLETAKQIGREAFKMNIPEAEKASKGYYTSLTPRQRMVAARNLGQFAVTGLGIMGVIKLLNKDDDDVKVTLNPFDSNFGIKIKDKQVNPFGRYASYMTGLLQVFFAMKYREGEKKPLGVGYKAETSGDVAFSRFVRGKMRPDVGLAYDYVFNNQKNYFTKEKIKPSDLAPAPMTWINLFKDIQRDKISTSLWNVPYQFIGGQVRDQRDFEESKATLKKESAEEKKSYSTKIGTKVEGEKRGTKVVGQKRGSQ